MTATGHDLPDWAVRGTPVVEVLRGTAPAWTKIVRVTPTGMVRLANGSAYRLASHGRSLHKVGEKGLRAGYEVPAELQPVDVYQLNRSRRVAADAAWQVGRIDQRSCSPSAVVARMQEIVDKARDRLAVIEQETTDRLAAIKGEQR
jgi:hypothetical protein